MPQSLTLRLLAGVSSDQSPSREALRSGAPSPWIQNITVHAPLSLLFYAMFSPSLTPRPTAVATVLSLNELLYAIFDQIPEPDLSYIRSDRKRSALQALANCSVVSRSFSESAIRVLWRSLPSLDPVWALLSAEGRSAHASAGDWYNSVSLRVRLTSRKNIEFTIYNRLSPRSCTKIRSDGTVFYTTLPTSASSHMYLN